MSNARSRIYTRKNANNFRELINQATDEFNTDIAFTIKNKKDNSLKDISFIDFKNDIDRLGTAILDLGFSNQKIGLLAPNCYQWCVSYLAVATSNNIIVPLDFLLPEFEIKNLLIQSKLDGIIISKKHLDIVMNLVNAKAINLKKIITIEDYKNPNVIDFFSLLKNGETLIKNGYTTYFNQIIDDNKLSVLIYTSGTTSKPKGVMLSQYNICSNVSDMTMLEKHNPNDSMLIFLPLHHTLACTTSFLWCYFTGFRIYFADSIKDIGKNMKEYHICGIVGVPAVIDIIHKTIIRKLKKLNRYKSFKFMSIITNILYFFKIDVRRKVYKEIIDALGGNIKRIICGSASANKDVLKFFKTVGINIYQGYGLSEASPVISVESDKYNGNLNSAGTILDSIAVKIDNPDINGIGEICAKGPNIMLGYYKNEEATNKTIIDGWLHTGDLGKIDKKGTLFVTGRIKDMIVLSNGKKVFPEDIETLLNKINGIEESFVFESKDGLEQINAKIVYSSKVFSSKESAKEFIAKSLVKINKTIPVYAYVRNFTLTTTPLIKTTTGKIKRAEEIKTINIH